MGFDRSRGGEGEFEKTEPILGLGGEVLTVLQDGPDSRSTWNLALLQNELSSRGPRQDEGGAHWGSAVFCDFYKADPICGPREIGVVWRFADHARENGGCGCFYKTNSRRPRKQVYNGPPCGPTGYKRLRRWSPGADVRPFLQSRPNMWLPGDRGGSAICGTLAGVRRRKRPPYKTNSRLATRRRWRINIQF